MSTLPELLAIFRGKPYTRITVTGPQRSGTTIAAEILAEELGYQCFPEGKINVADLHAFFQLYNAQDRFVLQAPALCSFAHALPGCVVLMRRSVDDIIRSQNRIGWGGHERGELVRYFADHGPIARVKYDAWDRYQKPQMSHGYELEYESLRGHRLWLEQEQRQHFHGRQTKP